ncbi:hypothetical protein EPN81_04515 [Patescibacteria group bacterium]|nr:MAG: hypothetical protein EPN81_04515 [Patescibacteria group bacterium]
MPHGGAMKRKVISREQDLQDLLARNQAYANGKNSPVAHLYATVATSRFDIENIFGIYLTRPAYAWMALWMAVTNREVLRKRHLTYYAPRDGDSIGSIAVGGTDVSLGDLLCDQAFLYLFEPDVLPKTETDFFPDTHDEQVQEELITRDTTGIKSNVAVRLVAPSCLHKINNHQRSAWINGRSSVWACHNSFLQRVSCWEGVSWTLFASVLRCTHPFLTASTSSPDPRHDFTTSQGGFH